MSPPLALFLLAVVSLGMSTDVWLKLGSIGLRFVWPGCAALASWSLRNVCPNGSPLLPNALVLRGYAAADSGDTQRAVADADLALETARRASPDVCRWDVVNAAIDILATVLPLSVTTRFFDDLAPPVSDGDDAFSCCFALFRRDSNPAGVAES